MLETEPLAGAVALSLSKRRAPVSSVNVVPSVLQKTLKDVGRVPEELSKAVQSKLSVPAVRPVKFRNKSTATASGVVPEPVDKKTIAPVPFCRPPVLLVTNVAEDFVVLSPVSTAVPVPIMPTLPQLAASVPLAKSLPQFAMSEKFHVLSPLDIVYAVAPQPVVAKVIKAAQIARAWNLKLDFATPDFRP